MDKLKAKWSELESKYQLAIVGVVGFVLGILVSQ
jgi:hypothetical protein